MLMLLLRSRDAAYAIDTSYVIEVVPRVSQKKIPHSPDYMTGFVNYAGRPIPVIDFCRIIDGKPASHSLHTRIILLKCYLKGEECFLGLLAEKVTETFDCDSAAFVESGFNVQDLPFLKGVLTDKDFSVQLISVEELFKAMQNAVLSRPEE